MGISFEFKNGQERFVAGTPVEGTIRFVVKDDISSVDELLIYLEGKGKLHWKRGKHHYINKEKYFRMETHLLQNIPDNKLSKGIHEFPFSFLLPKETPQTLHFEDIAEANVTYMLKGRIMRSGIHFNIKHKKEIYVLGNLQLSDFPGNRMEVPVGRGEKIPCCWCCKQGPISAEITCDKTVYTPGESVTVNVNIENLSNQDLLRSKLKFYRQFRLVTKYRTEEFKDVTFNKVATTGCRAHRSVDIKDQQFQIPLDSVPSLTSSEIIFPEYVVQLHGVIGGCHKSFKVKCNISVASLPSDNVPGEAADAFVVPQAPLEDAPPPCYESATGFENSLTGATGDSAAPTGEYYDWNKSAFTYN